MTRARALAKAASLRWRASDRVVRAVIANWIGGMIVGLVCAALLLACDSFGIRSLLWRSDVCALGTIMLFLMFAFTFGGIVCAAAVMQFGSDDDDEPRGGRRARGAATLRPILANVPAGRGR
jgi:hypothetical protein